MSDEKKIKKENESGKIEENEDEYEIVYAVRITASASQPGGIWKTYATYEEAQAEAERFNDEQAMLYEIGGMTLDYLYNSCSASVDGPWKRKKKKEG